MAALEAELAFQTDTCRELSDALATQQLDILTLQRQVRYLSDQLAALRERERHDRAEAPDDERPPHY
ncbi:MAG: SlyX family protein [Pseudomonadota bacterium]